MERTYKPKVKFYTGLLFESVINEVGKGATTSSTARKYYMSASWVWWRIIESNGLTTRKKELPFQSDVCVVFLKLYWNVVLKIKRNPGYAIQFNNLVGEWLSW